MFGTKSSAQFYLGNQLSTQYFKTETCYILGIEDITRNHTKSTKILNLILGVSKALDRFYLFTVSRNMNFCSHVALFHIFFRLRSMIRRYNSLRFRNSRMRFTRIMKFWYMEYLYTRNPLG